MKLRVVVPSPQDKKNVPQPQQQFQEQLQNIFQFVHPFFSQLAGGVPPFFPPQQTQDNNNNNTQAHPCFRRCNGAWSRDNCKGSGSENPVWKKRKYWGLQSKGIHLMDQGDYKTARECFAAQLGLSDNTIPLYYIH